MTVPILQRLRIVFRKGAEIKYISHLDLVRVWERALRRADIALAYSHGFSSHPRMFFASALPVGIVGHAEMLDILLERPIPPRDLGRQLRTQLPCGLELVSVTEVPLTLPSLPAQVVAAQYEVCFTTQDSATAIESRLNTILAAPSIPRRMEREGKTRVYDLRPLIQRLWLIGWRDGLCVIGMRLRADEQGTGRPHEVMAALGLEGTVCSVERVRLILKQD